MTMVFTEDGRLYSGVLAGEDKRQLRLRVANEEEPVVIAKSQIEDRVISKLSMMPEGLLNDFKDHEILDLIAYLRSLEPVPMQDVDHR